MAILNSRKLLHNPAIPLTLRKKVGKFLQPPKPGQEFTANIFGNKYLGITGNHQDNKVYTYGIHEPATIRLMRGIAQTQRAQGISPVYLDIGTNSGQHLMAMSNAVDIAAGFEPWETARKRVEKNIAANGYTHIKIFPHGLSNEDAELPYFPPQGDNLGVGSFAVGEGKHVVLSVRHADSFIASQSLKPTIIKIDTEGYEYRVLKGLHDCLRKFRPAVIFEYGGQTRKDMPDEKSILAMFPENYALFGIVPSREYPKLVPFRPGRRYENVLVKPSL